MRQKNRIVQVRCVREKTKKQRKIQTIESNKRVTFKMEDELVKELKEEKEEIKNIVRNVRKEIVDHIRKEIKKRIEKLTWTI